VIWGGDTTSLSAVSSVIFLSDRYHVLIVPTLSVLALLAEVWQLVLLGSDSCLPFDSPQCYID